MSAAREFAPSERRPIEGGAAPTSPSESAARTARRIGWTSALVGVALGAGLAWRALRASASIEARPSAPNTLPERAASSMRTQHAESSDAAKLLAELDRQSFAGPNLDGHGLSPSEQLTQHQATAQRIVELTEELRRVAPEHPRTIEWMDKRWALFVNMLERHDDVFEETARIAEDSESPLRRTALLARAEAGSHHGTLEFAERVKFADAAERADCDRTRVSLTWVRLASVWATSAEDQRECLRRATNAGASIEYMQHPLRRLRERVEQVGQPVALRFDDALTGAHIELVDFVGRPVLILAWSGDSPDVLAAIEAAKRAQRELGPRGLVVLGAHEWRIEGGVEALRARLAELEFDVPHLYEEPESPWVGQVRELGVRECPCAILVDPHGRVVLSSERVDSLRTSAEALLAR